MLQYTRELLEEGLILSWFTSLFSSFVRDGISACNTSHEKWRVLFHYGLSATSSSTACTVDSSAFAAFLLDLPGGSDPVDDVVPFVQHWVQVQPKSFHFSYISPEMVCTKVGRMLFRLRWY